MAKLELDLRVSLKDIPTGSVELVFVKWWRNVRQKYRQSPDHCTRKITGNSISLGEMTKELFSSINYYAFEIDNIFHVFTKSFRTNVNFDRSNKRIIIERED